MAAAQARPGASSSVVEKISWEELKAVYLAYLEGRYIPAWAIALKFVAFYLWHKKEVDEGLALVPDYLHFLAELRKTNLPLYHALGKTSMEEIFGQLPQTVTPQNAAFVLGRLFRATVSTTEDGHLAVVLVGAGVKTLAVLLSMDLPGIYVRAVARATEKHLAELVAAASDPKSQQVLRALARLAHDLTPVLQKLALGWQGRWQSTLPPV